MTREELIACLSGAYHADFAAALARRVCEDHALGLLYEAAAVPPRDLPQSVRRKVRFRGAYVLERCYFGCPAQFAPYADRFCREDFPVCDDPSARRHFAKIMAHLLQRQVPDRGTLNRIAEAAAQWAIDPRTKPAVRVWAVEVLKCCREWIEWVAAVWPDLLETLARVPAPAIENRMRKSWRKDL